MSLRWSSLRSLEVSLSRALTPLVGEFSCLRLERSGGISPLPLPLQPAALLRTSAGVAALNISNQQQQEKLEEVKRSVSQNHERRKPRNNFLFASRDSEN